MMTKNYILTFSLLMFCHLANAQAPDSLWTKTLGGSFNDKAYSICPTIDNGSVVAGYSKSIDGDVHGNQGSGDYWLVKLDEIGDTLWTKTYGGSDDDWAYSIQQTSDTGYIVAGFAWSTDGDVRGNHGAHDFWLLKLSSTGDTIWTKCLGGTSYDDAYSIRQTSDDGYIVAGYTASINGDVHGNHGYHDFWVVKLNNNGDTVWTQALGGKSRDEAWSVWQTRDNGYIVAGTANSNDGDVHNNHGADDYWVVRLNTNGDTIWTKTYGGSGWDNAYSIQQTFDGGFVIAGAGASYDGDVHGYQGGEADFWVIKTDSNGDTLWTRTYGGSNLDVARAIYQTPDTGYIVTGYTQSTDGDVHGNSGGSDYWIIKLDQSGDTIWTKTMGGTQNDEAYDIQLTNDGSYIIAGDARSFNGDVHGNHGYHDFWITSLEGPPVSPYSILHAIPLATGWNNMSFNVSPPDSDMLTIVQPLIDAGELVKVVDEAGGVIQDIPGIGWVNTIGNMANTEGYYIKVDGNTQLELTGMAVSTPFSIPLTTGWNIMGYPLSQSQNALTAIQPLIDENELIKVLNESGGFIQDIPGIGWVNTIHNFEPGEGYYIKVTNNTSLTLDIPAARFAAYSNSPKAEPFFFKPSPGNPYMPMNILVSDINIEGQSVQVGDEIAVFDKGLLVGAGVVGAGKNAIVDIVVAMDDPLTTVVDGYTEGNLPEFRYKSVGSVKSIPLEATPVFGSPAFLELGTFVCKLQGRISTIEEEKETPVNMMCIPNPANDYSSITYNLSADGQVLLEVFDLNGRRIMVLQNEMMSSGRQQYRFDVGILKNGVYVIKLQATLKSATHAEIIKFVKN